VRITIKGGNPVDDRECRRVTAEYIAYLPIRVRAHRCGRVIKGAGQVCHGLPFREGHFLEYICLTYRGRRWFCQRFGLGLPPFAFRRDCRQWRPGDGAVFPDSGRVVIGRVLTGLRMAFLDNAVGVSNTPGQQAHVGVDHSLRGPTLAVDESRQVTTLGDAISDSHQAFIDAFERAHKIW